MSNRPVLPRFDDGKAPDALRTIGEVASALGIKQHILRYWEQQFPSLRPLKRSGGRRYYRAEDIALVGWIDQLVNHQGYTIKGARQVIEGGDAEDSAMVAPRAGDQTGDHTELLKQLHALRERLEDALAAA